MWRVWGGRRKALCLAGVTAAAAAWYARDSPLFTIVRVATPREVATSITASLSDTRAGRDALVAGRLHSLLIASLENAASVGEGARALAPALALARLVERLAEDKSPSLHTVLCSVTLAAWRGLANAASAVDESSSERLLGYSLRDVHRARVSLMALGARLHAHLDKERGGLMELLATASARDGGIAMELATAGLVMEEPHSLVFAGSSSDSSVALLQSALRRIGVRALTTQMGGGLVPPSAAARSAMHARQHLSVGLCAIINAAATTAATTAAAATPSPLISPEGASEVCDTLRLLLVPGSDCQPATECVERVGMSDVGLAAVAALVESGHLAHAADALDAISSAENTLALRRQGESAPVCAVAPDTVRELSLLFLHAAFGGGGKGVDVVVNARIRHALLFGERLEEQDMPVQLRAFALAWTRLLRVRIEASGSGGVVGSPLLWSLATRLPLPAKADLAPCLGPPLLRLPSSLELAAAALHRSSTAAAAAALRLNTSLPSWCTRVGEACDVMSKDTAAALSSMSTLRRNAGATTWPLNMRDSVNDSRSVVATACQPSSSVTPPSEPKSAFSRVAAAAYAAPSYVAGAAAAALPPSPQSAADTAVLHRHAALLCSSGMDVRGSDAILPYNSVFFSHVNAVGVGGEGEGSEVDVDPDSGMRQPRVGVGSDSSSATPTPTAALPCAVDILLTLSRVQPARNAPAAAPVPLRDSAVEVLSAIIATPVQEQPLQQRLRGLVASAWLASCLYAGFHAAAAASSCHDSGFESYRASICRELSRWMLRRQDRSAVLPATATPASKHVALLLHDVLPPIVRDSMLSRVRLRVERGLLPTLQSELFSPIVFPLACDVDSKLTLPITGEWLETSSTALNIHVLKTLAWTASLAAQTVAPIDAAAMSAPRAFAAPAMAAALRSGVLIAAAAVAEATTASVRALVAEAKGNASPTDCSFPHHAPLPHPPLPLEVSRTYRDRIAVLRQCARLCANVMYDAHDDLWPWGSGRGVLPSPLPALLRAWLSSCDMKLRAHAWRAAANVGLMAGGGDAKEARYGDMLLPLHEEEAPAPSPRSEGAHEKEEEEVEVDVDVILVHGLQGAALKAWRSTDVDPCVGWAETSAVCSSSAVRASSPMMIQPPSDGRSYVLKHKARCAVWPVAWFAPRLLEPYSPTPIQGCHCARGGAMTHSLQHPSPVASRGRGVRVASVRVMALRYDAPIVGGGSTRPLSSLSAYACAAAEQLIAAGVGSGRGAEQGAAAEQATGAAPRRKRKRITLWLAHSMGGLLTKELLLLAAAPGAPPATSTLLSSTAAAVFFATPHRGTSAATWIVAGLAATHKWLPLSSSQRTALAVPSFGAALTQSPETDARNAQFGALYTRLRDSAPCPAHPPLSILSLGEADATPLAGVGGVNSSRGLFNLHIVPPSSSNPGFAEFISLPNTHHFSVCKAGGAADARCAIPASFCREALLTKALE